VSTQLEKLKEVIHKARWIDGEIPSDEHLANAVLEAGFVIPQVKLPTPATAMLRSWDNEPDYSPDSPHYGKPHEDCCK
jgi:hypothetical protein